METQKETKTWPKAPAAGKGCRLKNHSTFLEAPWAEPLEVGAGSRVDVGGMYRSLGGGTEAVVGAVVGQQGSGYLQVCQYFNKGHDQAFVY